MTTPAAKSVTFPPWTFVLHFPATTYRSGCADAVPVMLLPLAELLVFAPPAVVVFCCPPPLPGRIPIMKPLAMNVPIGAADAVVVALPAVVWLPCCAKAGWPPFVTRSSDIAPRSTTPVAIASTELPSLFAIHH